MAERNIAPVPIGTPSQLQTGGFNFATGASNFIPATPVNPGEKGLTLGDTLGAVNKAIKPHLDKLKGDAFLQGQVDRSTAVGDAATKSAELIKDRSWLTRDSYAQGVHYNEYAEKQLKTQATIQESLKKSAAAGDDLLTATNKIKPIMSDLNRSIDVTLKGAAREAAQKQLLSYVAVAQEDYQTYQEEIRVANHKGTMNQVATANFETLMTTYNAKDIGTVLTSGFSTYKAQGMEFDPTSAVDEAARYTEAAVSQVLANANPFSDVDVQRLYGISEWARDTDASGELPPDARSRILSAVVAKQREFQDKNEFVLFNNLRDWQVLVAGGVEIPRATLNKASYQAQAAASNQQISVAAANQYLNGLAAIASAQDKDAAKLYGYLNAGPDVRRATGESDAAHATKMMQHVTQVAHQAGKPELVGAYAMSEGTRLKNSTLRDRGAEHLVDHVSPFLSMNPQEWAQSPDPLAQKSFAELKRIYDNSVVKGGADLEGIAIFKALNKALGRDGSDAFRRIMEQSSTVTIEDLLHQYPQAKEAAARAHESGALYEMYGKGIKIDGKTLKSSWFGQAGGLNNTLGAEWFDELPDTLLDRMALVIDRTWRENRAELFPRYTLGSDKDIIKAMRTEGMLVTTDWGTTVMSRNARVALGGGSMASDDTINNAERAIRNKVMSELGDEFKVDEDHIMITYTPAGASVQVITDNLLLRDTNLPGADIPMYQLRDMVANEYVSKTAPIKAIGDLGIFPWSGGTGNSVVVEDTQKLFGAEANGFKVEALNYISERVGYYTRPVAPNPLEPNDIRIGHGIPVKKFEEYFGEGSGEALAAVASDPSSDEYVQLFDQYVNKVFENFPEVLATAGINTGPMYYSLPGLVLARAMYMDEQSAHSIAEAMAFVQKGGDPASATTVVQRTLAYQKSPRKYQDEMLEAIKALRY